MKKMLAVLVALFVGAMFSANAQAIDHSLLLSLKLKNNVNTEEMIKTSVVDIGVTAVLAGGGDIVIDAKTVKQEVRHNHTFMDFVITNQSDIPLKEVTIACSQYANSIPSGTDDTKMIIGSNTKIPGMFMPGESVTIKDVDTGLRHKRTVGLNVCGPVDFEILD